MSGSVNAVIAEGINPLAQASQQTDIQTRQFQLQQAQLQPAYQAMRQVMATNQNPSWDDVNYALGQSKRIGGNVNGLVANAQETAAKGGNAADFMRANALGGMSPWEQGVLAGPQQHQFQTGAGTVYGTMGGPWSGAQAGQFTPGGFVAQGLSPGEATELVPVPQPDGTIKMVPRGTLFGTGVPGGGGAATGGGGGDLSGLNKPDFLQAVAQRESGGNPTALNYVAKADPTAYARGATASGKYQMVNSTWQRAAGWAGVDTSKYPTAMSAPEGVQDQVASALYDHEGQTPWQQGSQNWVKGPGGGYTLQAVAPGTGGGTVAAGPGSASGPFIGATSAQPVGGGGMQHFGPTGAPADGGGGTNIPGVTRGPGGAPILSPVSPYTTKQFEQSANDFANDQQLDRALPQRTAPLQQALSILSSNKSLQTGPVQDEINHWQTAARALGMDVGTTQNITDYQTLAKTLAQNMRGLPGANNSDLARLEAQAASPNMMQAREAIQELAAKQLGMERMRSAQYRQYVAQSGGVAPASMNSQNYNLQTADWMAKQDPLAYSLDALPAQARLEYVNSLKGQARARFFQSYQNAKQLYGVDVTNAPE
jgi:Transglycosylase-like domain